VPVLAEFRALDRRVWFLSGARLVVMAGFFMVLPLLGVHLAIERHVPAVAVGFIWTVAGMAGAAMQWVAGELADRVGRRPLMLSSLLLRAANLAALGHATATDGSVVLIGALVVANNMLRAFFDPVANALVADLVPSEQRVAAFSLQRVGINIGCAAGPAMAAIAMRYGYRYSNLFYASVPFTIAAAVGIAFIHMPRAATSPRPPGWRELFAFHGDRPFVRFLVATFFFFLLQAQLYQTLSIYAAGVLGLHVAQIGTFFTVNGLLVVFLQLPAVGFIRRMGTRAALVVGCLGYAAGYAAVGLARGYASVLVCVAFVTLAEIVTAPAQQTTVTMLAPLGRVGAYSGLYGLCQIAGQSAGPLLGTAALDVVPPRAAWFLLALFGVGAAFFYRMSGRPAVVATRPGPAG
jgi:predicted MFS family arabinose efflux permease